jgi:hypothetical protein
MDHRLAFCLTGSLFTVLQEGRELRVAHVTRYAASFKDFRMSAYAESGPFDLEDRPSSLVHPRRIRLQPRTPPVTFRITAL